uniref:RING-type domain-containing protein n=1 Tax=Paramormyrops kingsleyae TaxID=1676925 RepID=A0A3B3SWZ1_9TELE
MDVIGRTISAVQTWNDINAGLNLFSHSSDGITHCEYCKQEFKDPAELQCGHIFCKSCLEEVNAKKCLKCQKDITELNSCDLGKRCV